MNIFIVEKYEYSHGDGDLDIIGSFSSKEKAEEFVRQVKEAMIVDDYDCPVEEIHSDPELKQEFDEWENGFEITEIEVDNNDYLDGYRKHGDPRPDPVPVQAMRLSDVLRGGM